MARRYNIDQIRRLQKNVRDKEYRLRKKGAADSSAALNSPRQPWSSVKTMTKSQLNAYGRELERYKARENRLVVLKSGETISKSTLDKIDELTAKWNARARAERERIGGLTEDASDIIKKRIEQNRSRLRGTVFGSIADLENLEMPTTVAAAKYRLAQLEDMNNLSFAKRRAGQRRNMVSILDQMGEYGLATMVRNMTNNQFDVLSATKNIWEWINMYYKPKEAKGREDAGRFDDMGHERVASMIYEAKNYDKEARYIKVGDQEKLDPASPMGKAVAKLQASEFSRNEKAQFRKIAEFAPSFAEFVSKA